MSAWHEPRWGRADSARALHNTPAPGSSTARAPGAAAIIYRAIQREWWLWWRCPECGWVDLPLRDGRETLCRDSIGPDRCPGCETRRRRAGRAQTGPVVWYDTLARDWVVRLPGPAAEDGGVPHVDAILPLGLHFYDTPWAEIVRTAADLAYAGDTLARP